MKTLGLLLLVSLFLTSCGATDSEEEAPNETKDQTEDVTEMPDEKADEKEEALPFDEWLETADIPYKELILPGLDQMSAEDILTHYRNELEVSKDWVSMAYRDFQTEETFYHREDEVLTAASTTKVLLAMLYIDLIEEETLTFDSYIPYNPTAYEEGGGEITAGIVAGEGQNSYTLDYTLQEMIVRSDNTATNMLRQFYSANYQPLGEGMSRVINDSNYTAEMLEQNETTAALLEETLIALLENEAYAPILEHMRLADEELYFKYYIEEEMPVKYGLLYELKHHTGIYEIDEEPAYSLVILTSHLEHNQANEFFGGINLQLSTRAQYRKYVHQL